MARTGFVKLSASVVLAAILSVPAAVSANAASLEELRAKKGPEEKIAKLKQQVDELKQEIKDLKQELKLVEGNLVPFDTYFSTDLDASAKDGDNMYAGTGIPATSFVVQKDDIEAGLKIHYRQGFDIPVSYIDTEGVIHVFVPSGAQIIDPERGVSVANADRAAWNVAFSVNTAYGTTDTLDDIQAKLKFDRDPGSGVNFLTLDLAQVNEAPTGQQNGWGWTDGETDVIGDDEGTSQVTQNSFNYAFILDEIIGGYAGFPPATFDIQLLVKGHAEIKLRVHVVAEES